MGAWDFIGESTSEYTHDIHLYPARLNLHVARRLIKMYGKNAKNMLDPYCGSGTTLVEAKLAGIDSHGFDINPFARLLSKVKTQEYDIVELTQYFDILLGLMSETPLVSWEESIERSGIPEDVLKTWMPKNSAKEVATTLNIIQNQEAPDEFRDLACVLLSDCLRAVSNQRPGEWKLYRKTGFLVKDLKKGADINKMEMPSLIELMRGKVDSALESLTELSEKLNQSKYQNKVTIFDINSVKTSNFETTPEGGYDLVITSPPYGDSPTTVAYSQFSWFSNTWLGLDTRPHGKLASEMMGGNTRMLPTVETEVKKIGCRSIDTAISRMDDDFALKNYIFYKDYLESIKNVAQNVKSGGFICYVVGNRTSGEEYLRMDLFTKWAFEKYGFKSREIKERVLPNKRMPRTVAVVEDGEKRKISTMNKEQIVVCQKK